MLRTVLFFLLPLTLVACANGDEIEMDDDRETGPASLDLTIQGDNPFNDPATLLLEFTEEGQQIGESGWHLEYDYELNIFFDATGNELQGMLTDAGHSVIYSRVECVRLQVVLHGPDENRYACEGNEEDATLVLNLGAEWGGVQQTLSPWSDPSGDGCSPSFCK